MREAIGGTWLFQIVIFFVLLFAGYICLSINHSKAFAIKNNIILELQRNGAYNKTAQKNVGNMLRNAGYRTSGKCEAGWTGYNRDGAKDNNNAVFCLKQISIKDAYSYTTSSGKVISEYPESYYYKIKVFYQLDLPVFSSLFSFSVNGDTETIFPVKSSK